MRRRKDSGWIILAWMLNFAGLAGIALVLILYRTLKPKSPVQQSISNETVTNATASQFPTPYYLPTVTPNPLSTLIIVESPTPFILAGGTRPAVIGTSVSGRPIEVFTFGNGEKQRMIVAGIHGGYEWNTIALADELISHIYAHPNLIFQFLENKKTIILRFQLVVLNSFSRFLGI